MTDSDYTLYDYIEESWKTKNLTPKQEITFNFTQVSESFLAISHIIKNNEVPHSWIVEVLSEELEEHYKHIAKCLLETKSITYNNSPIDGIYNIVPKCIHNINLIDYDITSVKNHDLASMACAMEIVQTSKKSPKSDRYFCSRRKDGGELCFNQLIYASKLYNVSVRNNFGKFSMELPLLNSPKEIDDPIVNNVVHEQSTKSLLDFCECVLETRDVSIMREKLPGYINKFCLIACGKNINDDFASVYYSEQFKHTIVSNSVRELVLRSIKG